MINATLLRVTVRGFPQVGISITQYEQRSKLQVEIAGEMAHNDIRKAVHLLLTTQYIVEFVECNLGAPLSFDILVQCLQLCFSLLALGDVTYRAGDQHAILGFNRAETDLHRKFPACPGEAEQFSFCTHGTGSRVTEESLHLPGVLFAVTLWYQLFNGLSGDFVAGITEHFFSLAIDHDDLPRCIDNNHRVRGGFEQGTETLLTLLDTAHHGPGHAQYQQATNENNEGGDTQRSGSGLHERRVNFAHIQFCNQPQVQLAYRLEGSQYPFPAIIEADHPAGFIIQDAPHGGSPIGGKRYGFACTFLREAELRQELDLVTVPQTEHKLAACAKPPKVRIGPGNLLQGSGAGATGKGILTVLLVKTCHGFYQRDLSTNHRLQALDPLFEV